MGADAGKVGLLKKSIYGTRDAASHWECDWQEHIKSWGFRLGLSSKNLFCRKVHQVSGMTHGDDFVLTGPTERLAEFKSKMKGVYPIKAKIINHGSTESIKALNRKLHWRKRGVAYQHDPRHPDVLVKELGLERGNSVQTPVTHDATEGEGRAVGSSSAQQVQVASCKMFVPQSRSSGHNVLCERVMSEDVKPRSTEHGQVEGACQVLET